MRPRTAKLILQILGCILAGILVLGPIASWPIFSAVGIGEPYILFVVAYSIYGFMALIVGIVTLVDKSKEDDSEYVKRRERFRSQE
jgi:hypothetical protein